MHIRANSPSNSRPASPPKQTVLLPGIPEVTPGPNAFAQQAARMERHRIEGNAFYQQEVQKRTITPPSTIHPALREPSVLDAPSMLGISMQADRESSATTMSAFINAGKKPSLPLSFVPSNGKFAEPTRRGYIEERREQITHELSGSDEDRTPVYQTYAPTPKPPSSEFVSNTTVASTTPRKTRVSLPRKDTTSFTSDAAPRSPKKSLFERLRITKFTGGTPSPSMSTLSSAEGFVVEEAGIPVKAQAVLGASPSKTSLMRSPSKQKKALFASRKAAEVSDIATSTASSARKSGSTDMQDPPRTASSQARTPQTAHTTVSDPTHYSFVNGKRIPSQTLSDRGAHCDHAANKCAIQRSQSLKYFDPGVPPTPPAKNTPPDQKALSGTSGAGTSNRVPFHQAEATPSKAPAGMVSTSDRLSPTRFGSYGYKETPTLVTKPSIYSLHASVVPEVMEATTFEEMKARIDGLGLEGFNMPAENHYNRSPEMVYSPSIYSSDWGVRNSIIARTPRSGQRLSMNELPSVAELPNERDQGGHRTKQSSSSGGTIPVCYPELESDPSMHDLTPQLKGHARSHTSPDLGLSNHTFRDLSDAPVHGRTHSRDHSNSPTHSMDISLFAMPFEDVRSKTNNASPASYKHPSAMPSPLHYLPATVYTPPPKASRKRAVDQSPVPQRKQESARDRGSELGTHHADTSIPALSARTNNILDGAPILPAQLQRTDSTSPRTSVSAHSGEIKQDVDPEKPGYAKDKMDKMLEMLSSLTSRNHEVEAMREEMRATNARLDARLAVVESTQRSSPSPNSSTAGFDGASSFHEEPVGRRQSRIPTDVAHDFYRLGQSQGPSSSPATSLNGASGDADPKTEANKIEKLTETNRHLTEMMQGFAAELEAIKMRFGGNA